MKKKLHLSIALLIFLICSIHGNRAAGQAFVNGSFENTSAIAGCTYNLSNAGYNALMPGTNAYGAGNEIDIMVAGCYVPNIVDGLYCIALAADPSDEVAIDLTAPMIMGQPYTFTFWAYSDITIRVQGNLEIGLSANNTSFGTPIYTAITIPATWIQYTVSFVAPITGSYITVKNSPGAIHWNRIDAFTFDVCSTPLNIGPDTSICQGSSLLLNVTVPNGSYLWQDNSTDSTFIVTQAGTYFVEVTTAGCTRSDTIVVALDSIPVVSLAADTVLCQGEILLLDATTANATYVWQDSSSNATFSVTQQGTYIVEVTVNNCSALDSVIIDYIPLPLVNLANDTSLCNGETLLLNVATANGTYLWQDNSTDSTYQVTQAGTYVVSVTVNNCTATDSIVVGYNAFPVVILAADTTLCQGETLLLDATTANGSYVWQDNSTNATLTVSQQGTYYVAVTVNNCTASDSITVNYISLPVVSLSADTTLCQGETLILDVTTSNGSYIWQDNSTAPTFTVTQQGTYWVQVTVNGCSAADSINISYNALPSVNLPADTTLCNGDALQLNVSVANGSYLWNDNSTNATYSVTQPGTYSVQVTVNNCSASDSILVNFTPNPVFNLAADTTLCQGQTLQLNANTANASYQWQDNSTNATYTVSQSGTYWVQVTVNSCSAVDSINVNFNTVPLVNLTNDTTLCESELLVLDATTTNGSYLWNDNSTNATLTVSQQGTYYVEVTVNNCSSSDTVTVNYTSLPEIQLTTDNTLCIGDTIQLSAAISNGSYLWQDNSTSPGLTVTEAGIYTVTVTVGNCSRVYSTDIATEDCEIILEMPNIFTPNNDGANDHFDPIRMKGITSAILTVFTRWGQEIFVTDDILKGWNGKSSDNTCTDGTYVWIINYSDIKGNSDTKKGFVMLLQDNKK